MPTTARSIWWRRATPTTRKCCWTGRAGSCARSSTTSGGAPGSPASSSARRARSWWRARRAGAGAGPTPRLQAARERALAELSALNQIAQAINSVLELDQVLTVIREQVGRLIENDNFYIALYKE